MPILSGRSSFGLPQDVFNEVLTKQETDIFISNLRKNGPDYLLFDDFSMLDEKVVTWESFYHRFAASN